RDGERPALHYSEAAGSPPLGCRRDPLVEGRRVGSRLLCERPGPRVDLLRVLRADLLTRQIPLVEKEEGLATRLPPADQATPPATISSASVEVEYSPRANALLRSTSIASSRVEGTPSTSVSPT